MPTQTDLIQFELQAAFSLVQRIHLGSVDYPNYHELSLEKKKKQDENQLSPVFWRETVNPSGNARTPAWFLKGSHCTHN